MTLIILFPIIILIFSYIYDIFLGEPPLKIHPVVILGKIIDFTSIYFRKISQKRIAGLLFLLFIIILYVIPSAILFLIFRLNNPYAILIYLLISIYILKSTFSVKSMHDHILKIIHALELNNIDMARRSTSLVVRRSTENMTPGLYHRPL
ncbi:cobalamin biosynthesis protein [Acidiplasma cupricumulans]|uniref:cobalamin biosynthesis protein n=1 Tax=Acidiplasma cupricumulans TaxID=312540 RepID=UPI0007846869|nr:cobalamin biosynthesis protein [Acidiplasma cupricumulans]